nr:hypothetical protein [uncultured Helicobacter sp.]
MGRLFFWVILADCSLKARSFAFSKLPSPFAPKPLKSLQNLKAFGILMKSNQKPQGGEVSLSDFKSFQANKQEAYLR